MPTRTAPSPLGRPLYTPAQRQRRGADDAFLQGAGHAQHGHLRHDGREPPRADPAVLPAQLLQQGSAVRLGPQGLPHQRVGRDRGTPHLRRPVPGPKRHGHRGDADLRVRRVHRAAGGGERRHGAASGGGAPASAAGAMRPSAPAAVATTALAAVARRRRSWPMPSRR